MYTGTVKLASGELVERLLGKGCNISKAEGLMSGCGASSEMGCKHPFGIGKLSIGELVEGVRERCLQNWQSRHSLLMNKLYGEELQELREWSEAQNPL